jgi:heme exporter protein CcmD
MNFDMGAYGVYIWPAYGVSALALVAATVWTVAAWRAAKKKLASLEKK